MVSSYGVRSGAVILSMILLMVISGGCGDDTASSGEEENRDSSNSEQSDPNSEEPDPNDQDYEQSDEVAPRGVAALGGQGFNLVRLSPTAWADEHFVEASQSEGFEDSIALQADDTGAAVHANLVRGDTWYYRAVARTDDLEQRKSLPVSAAPTDTGLLSIHVEMDPDDVSELYERDPHSRDRLDAQLYIGAADGPEVDVRGIRFRGATTREYDKKGFNIRLDERPEIDDYPHFNFRSDDRRAGNRVAINALWTDPSSMREALSFEMYEELGLIAPTYYFTELYINDIFEGLYIGLERVDREAIRRWGLNRSRGEFTMVRDESKSNRHRDEISRRSIFGADIDGVVDSDEEAIDLFREIFRYRGETDDQDWEAVLELVRWVHATPAGATFEQQFRERFDVDAFTDFLAIHVISHDLDSLDIDYWLYRDDADPDGKWKLIPWDKNLTFGAHYFADFQGVNDFFDYDRGFLNTMGNALVDKFMATDGLRDAFDERLLKLTTEVFNDQWYQSKMEAIAEEIAPAMARLPDEEAYEIHPGQHHGKLGWWKQHKQALMDFVRLRRSYVKAQLGAEDSAVEAGHRVVDGDGWVVAELTPDDGESVDWTLDVEELDDGDWRGIDRQWTITAARAVSGELTLYWRHSPWESWYEELESPGAQWYLDAFFDSDGDWERVEGQVLPFSNRITVPVELEGTTVWRVGY